MRPARGFTLLELLIGIAVLGMLLVLLNQGVAFGLRAASMQAGATARQGDLLAVDRALRQVIADADPGLFPEPATLRGTATSLAMITELPSPTGGGRERVEAQLLARDGALRLRWTPRRHVMWFGVPPMAQETTLLTGVRGIGIGYFGAAGWQAEWTGQELPTLIRIAIVMQDAKRHWPVILAAPRREALE